MATITAETVTIRQHKPEDVKILMDISDENQWDFSTYDHEAYCRIDPSYLIVAADSSDEAVGFCGGSLHPPDIIYFGNFIVRKDLRGRGIGKRLFKAFLEKAKGKNMVLDGGSTMEDWYYTHGLPFKSLKVRYYNLTIKDDMKKSFDSNNEIVTFSEDLWPVLMEYDKKVYPNFDRRSILHAWFTSKDVRVVVAMDSMKIVGYGSIVKKPSSDTEYSLRNIFADSEEVIEAILHNMLSDLEPGALVRLWLIEDKPLPKYIQHSVYMGETARRMYSKYIIEVCTEKMWFATAHIV